MNYDHITQAYQNAERQALEEMNDHTYCADHV